MNHAVVIRRVGLFLLTNTTYAGSRKTYDMREVCPGGGASILVESLSDGNPIMVERAMYFGGRSGGYDDTVGSQY